MSKTAEKFIEDNIDLIEDRDFTSLYSKVRKEVGVRDLGQVISVLRQVDCDVPISVAPIMFGAKKYSRILSLRATKDGGQTWNVGLTTSQGMKGGHQIGFLTIADAEKFLSKFDNQCTVTQFQENTVNTYDWKKIHTQYGDCYATTTALASFNSSPDDIKELRDVRNEISNIQSLLDDPRYIHGFKSLGLGYPLDQYLEDFKNYVMSIIHTSIKEAEASYYTYGNGYLTIEFNKPISKKYIDKVRTWAEKYIPSNILSQVRGNSWQSENNCRLIQIDLNNVWSLDYIPKSTYNKAINDLKTQLSELEQRQEELRNQLDVI